MFDKFEPYFKEFLENFIPYKGFWCYEDGVILKGAMDLYEVIGDEGLRLEISGTKIVTHIKCS